MDIDIRNLRERVLALVAVGEQDPAVAHELEDEMRAEVLTWVANHSTDPLARAAALTALATRLCDFPRWYE